MNLKKLFVLVAALAVSTAAFAGNSSTNSALKPWKPTFPPF